jgi:hypothetical protein
VSRLVNGVDAVLDSCRVRNLGGIERKLFVPAVLGENYHPLEEQRRIRSDIPVVPVVGAQVERFTSNTPTVFNWLIEW